MIKTFRLHQIKSKIDLALEQKQLNDKQVYFDDLSGSLLDVESDLNALESYDFIEHEKIIELAMGMESQKNEIGDLRASISEEVEVHKVNVHFHKSIEKSTSRKVEEFTKDFNRKKILSSDLLNIEEHVSRRLNGR